MLSPVKLSLASAKVSKDKANTMKNNFGNSVEYLFPVKSFKEFLEEVKKQNLTLYTTGIGAKMGMEKSGNKFNIGLSTVFYKSKNGSITNYKTLPGSDFFGRISSDFTTPLKNKKTFNDYTMEADKESPTDPSLKPATIAVLEIIPLENLISEIIHLDADFASFEFARMDNRRLTILFSLKRKVGAIYKLLQPTNNPNDAYLDVHDLIPPPDSED